MFAKFAKCAQDQDKVRFQGLLLVSCAAYSADYVDACGQAWRSADDLCTGTRLQDRLGGCRSVDVDPEVGHGATASSTTRGERPHQWCADRSPWPATRALAHRCDTGRKVFGVEAATRRTGRPGPTSPRVNGFTTFLAADIRTRPGQHTPLVAVMATRRVRRGADPAVW